MGKQEFTENGFTYTVYDNGTVTAKGEVHENPASRNGMQSIKPEGYDSVIHDKGHLIAAREGGVAKDFNVFSQDRTMNRSTYKTIENNEVKLANNGYKVETEKIAYSSFENQPPDAFMINDTITSPDGKTQTVHFSFQNASAQEQEAQDEFISELDFYDEFDNPDPLRESMTPEEYNAIMEETDQYLPSIKDEFDMQNTTQISFDRDSVEEANTNLDTGGSVNSESSEHGFGNDAGLDSGNDAGAGVDM